MRHKDRLGLRSGMKFESGSELSNWCADDAAAQGEEKSVDYDLHRAEDRKAEIALGNKSDPEPVELLLK